MTPRPKTGQPKGTVITLRVDDEMLTGLKVIQERDGAPLSEQIRRGIELWLELKGVRKAERKRLAGRSRS